MSSQPISHPVLLAYDKPLSFFCLHSKRNGMVRVSNGHIMTKSSSASYTKIKKFIVTSKFCSICGILYSVLALIQTARSIEPVLYFSKNLNFIVGNLFFLKNLSHIRLRKLVRNWHDF